MVEQSVQKTGYWETFGSNLIATKILNLLSFNNFLVKYPCFTIAKKKYGKILAVARLGSRWSQSGFVP